MTAPGTNVAALLGLAGDPRAEARIEKFIRCNGASGLEVAAHETAAVAAKAGGVNDVWGYCVAVHNKNLARAATLLLVHLLENSLRARVDFLMSQLTAGPTWYTSPHSYLPRLDADNLQSLEDCKRVQDRTTPGPPYPLQTFASGAVFLENVPFWVLRRIVTHNVATRLRFLFANSAVPIAPTRVSALLENVNRSRNEIAHHRGIRLNLYVPTAAGLKELLEALEFDVAKTVQRVMDLVAEHNRQFPNPPQ